MIITKDFVVLNSPKTGSTFVRKVLIKIYLNRMKRSPLKWAYKFKLIKPPYQELLLPNIRLKEGLRKNLNQHGIFIQIPEKHQHKKIVSVVRNPYTKFLSTYNFSFWKQNPALPKELITENFPDFPNLSMDDYVDYIKLTVKHSMLKKPLDIKIGPMSIQFIQFFFKDPDAVLENLTVDYIEEMTVLKMIWRI